MLYLFPLAALQYTSKLEPLPELTWGPFLESPDNFSGPESYFRCVMFALKTQFVLVLKAEQ